MRLPKLALGLALAPVAALAADNLDRLPELVNAGRMEAAYALASEHVDEHAGQVRFDLYYGIAALDTGHVEEGIFALERVLFQQPGLDRARVELARGYFLQEEDRKAKEQFEIVLSHDPPPAVVDRIERYLAAIQRRADRYQATVTGHVQLEGGHDDNVNRVSEETTTIELLPGLPLEVGAQNERRSDAFAQGSGSLDLSYPIVPGLNFQAGLRANVRGYQDETEFDRKTASLRAGARYTRGPHSLTSFLQGRRIYVGSEPFLGGGGINVFYRYTFENGLGVHGSARANRFRYDTQEQRDATRALLGVGLSQSWSIAWNPQGRVTLLGGHEYADKDNQVAESQAERDIARLNTRLNLSPAAEWSVNTSFNVNASRYQSAGPIVPPEAREEETYTVELDVQWRPTVNWQVGPFVSYSERDSNVAIFEYKRTTGGLRVRYSFY